MTIVIPEFVLGLIIGGVAVFAVIVAYGLMSSRKNSEKDKKD